jgi:hypothetical protein|tara:strand:- start:457 stop:648 length:192 start_codon:yes stop_codon:yes gene_type:complete
MTQAENELQVSIDKIDRLDLTSPYLRYDIKNILFDHILKELKNERQLLNSAPSKINLLDKILS